MSTKYKFHDPDGIYFISTSVVNWIDVFTRRLYKDIVVDSLKYCISKKGLLVYGYVIMSNHIHLIIARDPSGNLLPDVLRDFKKYTAMNIIKAIRENSQESRKDWLLMMFEQAGHKNSNNTKYQFWQQDNHPIQLDGNWGEQKLDYIHRNPVEAGWVNVPEEYFYSSARNYSKLESPMSILSLYDGVPI